MSHSISNHQSGRWLVVLIFLMGFGLRLFQLGQDSFWNDEAEVLLVALNPDLGAALNSLPAHQMTLFEFLSLRLAAQISINEFFLRFLSVVWGILALGAAWRLLARLAGKSHANLAMLLLAIAPLQVHYSQELRFYSAAFFFYNLSTCLLLEAIECGGTQRWVKFAAITAIGINFHMYVILSLVNGPFWLVLAKKSRAQWTFFLASGLIITIVFTLEYVYLVANLAFEYKLLEWNNSVLEVIGQGLGWIILPAYLRGPLDQVWGSLCFALAMLGIATSLKQRATLVTSWLISSMLQIVFIYSADWLKNYWFIYRQVLIFLPLAMFFTTGGISALGHWLDRKILRFNPSLSSRAGAVLLILLLTIAGLYSLSGYYHWPKSTARSVSIALAKEWLPGQSILIVPYYESQLFYFYLSHALDRPDIAAMLQSSDTADFLIVNDFLSRGRIEGMAQLGFEPILLYENTWGAHSLFRAK